MTSEWQNLTLGEVVELKRGYDLPARVRVPGKIPVVSSSGISGLHAEAKVKGPGVVTGRYGTIGQVFKLDKDFWPLNTTLYVRDFKGNDPAFIYYFLQTLDYTVYSDKAAVPGVNRNHLHTAEVSLPPLEEQRAIAEILGALDEAGDDPVARVEAFSFLRLDAYPFWLGEAREVEGDEAEPPEPPG